MVGAERQQPHRHEMVVDQGPREPVQSDGTSADSSSGPEDRESAQGTRAAAMAEKTAAQITLDDILTVFSATKTAKKVVSNQKLFTPPQPSSDAIKALEQPKREFSSGTGYAKEYRDKELQLLKQLEPVGLTGLSRPPKDAAGDDLLDVAGSHAGQSAALSDLAVESTQQIYATYCNQAHVPNIDLPIMEHKADVLRMVDTYSTVVIRGATGCGKTTQVPQFVLDHCASKGVHCNIVVTQPRRIAAISVAHRVCQERHWSLGSIVGYQVGMDNQTSADTRLAYVTTGVLLERLIGKKDMNDYTHVIIDEVHERDQETDFLLLVVRKFLWSNSRGVKVILMSATINVEYFAEYFSSSLCERLVSAPIIEISGKMKEVKEYYIDSLRTLGELPEFDPDDPSIAPESFRIAHRLIKVFDKIEAVEQKVDVNKERFAPNRGAVLVFLPGYEEISAFTDMLREDCISLRWTILPLHSTVTQQEQQSVFLAPAKGHRKIILSTNIAESSITVPDIKYVIDYCLTKCLVCDPETKYSCLKMEWASKANCKQRQGRAGRVSEGRLYRMIPEPFYRDVLPEYGIPEMQRCPLELTVLKVKKLALDEPRAMLGLCLDPPDLGDIERAILVLKEVSALTTVIGGTFYPYDGELTFVGKVMAQLPMDVCLSKMILLGFVFGVMEDCIIMAACLSIQSMFSRPFQKMLEAYKSRMAWAEGSFSDCLAMLKAYKVWQSMRMQGVFARRGGLNEREWASRNFLQLKRLLEVEQLVREIQMRLVKFNIHCLDRPNRPPVDQDQHLVILRMVICGAFYPNYFYQEDLDETTCCRGLVTDPLCTVMVHGIPQNQGVLYDHALRSLLAPCSSRMKIVFEESRAAIEFLQKERRDGVLPAVYTAIKMRQLRLPLELSLFRPEDAKVKLERLQRLRSLEGSDGNGDAEKRLKSNRLVVVPRTDTLKTVALPPASQITVNMYCTHVVDCGHFYARYSDQSSQLVEQHMNEIINHNSGKNLKPLTTQPAPDMLVLAPFRGAYYRARIEETLENKSVRVFFLDYGNTENIGVAMLRNIDPETHEDVLITPAQAFECKLAEVRPAAMTSGKDQWTKPALELFSRLVVGQYLVGRVYSVVDNVVRLHLIVGSGPSQVNVNDELVKRGFADYCEENFLSKRNHQLRERVESYHQSLTSEAVDPCIIETMDEVDSTKLDTGMMQMSSRKAKLHGPFSPLESRLVGMSKLCSLRGVRVDRNSVNSVLLNGEPQNRHPRLLVAGTVSQSSTSDHVSLRNTTLMPSVPGLHCLMPLLFAPYCELRVNAERSEYTGALCGLGYEAASNLPLYPEHDLEVSFDIGFTDEDLFMVNKVRMMINLVLRSDPGMSVVGWNGAGLANCQDRARRYLLDLMSRKRQSIEPRLAPRRYTWNLVQEEWRVHAIVDGMLAAEDNVLPLLDGVTLEPSLNNLRVLRKKLQDLHVLASNCRTSTERMLRCPVCDVMSLNPYDLLQHLRTKSHLDKERQVLDLFERYSVDAGQQPSLHN
ncbi:ATP-dependent RNA helicase TDRD9 isoform X1 [Dermacentor silvarum]|uniref:ATP-dependent RNA helicase TDRD9 isoform X1 n=2 Tax=Dermacentor silvarum TaxID=543639 RepID=UPI002100B6EA|nr:ATP-dependent RNA helicase TDRD9 isoform X1 [Dermacentor silvarum]